MIFLSALLQQAIYDIDNRRIGSLRDICVTLNETFPIITALVVNPARGNGTLIVPWSQVRTIEEQPIQLSVDQAHIHAYEPGFTELRLRRDILDKQIVDTQGFRVVKVNDLKLAQIKQTARLVGVDISLSGLLRRLGWQRALDMLGRVTPLNFTERTITWNYVEQIEVVPAQQLAPALAGVGSVGMVPKVQLNVSQNKLSELHPADIADILEQLDISDAGAMLDRLDDETAADTLNEIEVPLQSELIHKLSPERASDLLERLAPDDAADILAEMPEVKAEQLLNLMPAAESQPIRDLLRYESETAGGIMNSEVLAQPQDATVEQVLLYLREHSEHLDMVYYLYIVDAERHLQGVVSLRQLVINAPASKMSTLMDRDVIRVNVNADQEEVARVIAKYDLIALPVVDDEDHLVGVVTVDDVIDVLHEEQAEDISEITGTDVEEAPQAEGSWLRNTLNRSVWLSLNVVAGFIMAIILANVFSPLLNTATALALVSGFLPDLQSRLALSGILCLTPMLLLTSGSAGSQALGIAGWELRSTRGRDLLQGFWRELSHGCVSGVFTSVLAGMLSWLLFRNLTLSLAIAFGFGLTLLVAALCGLLLPNFLQRLHLRGSYISTPLLNPVIALASLATFLAVTMMALNEVFK